MSGEEGALGWGGCGVPHCGSCVPQQDGVWGGSHSPCAPPPWVQKKIIKQHGVYLGRGVKEPNLEEGSPWAPGRPGGPCMCLERSSVQAEMEQAPRHPDLQAERGESRDPQNPVSISSRSPGRWKPLCSRRALVAGGAPPAPLFPSDPPLARCLPFLQRLPCLPKECTGWSERASRACVHACCARPPACVRAGCVCVVRVRVLQPTSLKQSQPRAAEARRASLRFGGRLLLGSRRCLRARALAAQGSGIPAAAAGPAARPGELGQPGGSRGLPKMEPAGGSWLRGSN